MIIESPPWMRRGFCRGVNPEIFSGDSSHYETAKEICNRCPVRTECLEFAIKNDEQGVWGGTTDEERKAQRRGGHRTTCPGCRGLDVYDDGFSEICVGCGFSWRIPS